MILTIKVIVIITIIIKCRDRYRTPTTTNNGAPCNITEWPKALSNIKKSSLASETAYSSLNVMNRVPRRLNSLLGILPLLISQNSCNNNNYNNNNDRNDIII